MSIKPSGRPSGSEYPVIKQVRLAVADAEGLSLLSREWRCSEAAAIRRAIHEKATEANALRHEISEADRENLARAAEQMQDYYKNDPEAREWAEFLGDEPAYEQG